jgi:hypothetical protein
LSDGITGQASPDFIPLSVAHPLSDTNGDNLNEVLLMNEAIEILDRILRRINEQQHELSFCGGALLRLLAEIHPVAPVTFYACSGWSAAFANSYTLL